MDLYLTPAERRRGVAVAIYEQIRDAIVEGRVRAGERLPTSRELAIELEVSRFSVTTAYGQLVAEGWLEGAGSAGTRVTAAQPALRTRRTRPGPAPNRRLAGVSSSRPDAAPTLDLRLGMPDASLFPHAEFRRQLGRAMRELGGAGAAYTEAEGHPMLRAAIAASIHRTRGVRASPDQIVVTAGAQQAFDLILGVLTQPGDVVAVEDPGYLRFRELALVRGVQLAPVPVDREGIVTSALPPKAKLAYVTPSHQYPLGPALSLARRSELLEWSRSTGAVLVEDDYDSEFRFSDRPLEPLVRLTTGARVLYVGTFSKTLSPALRLGFIVAPPDLASSIARMRRLVDWHSPTLLCHALARFLTDGEMDRHLRRARRAYATRHRMVGDWLAQRGRRIGAALATGAGLHVALELRDGDASDEEALVARARDAGLALDGLSTLCIRAPCAGIGIGFGNVSPAELERALRIIEKVART